MNETLTKREIYVKHIKEVAAKNNLHCFFKLVLDPTTLVFTFSRTAENNDRLFPHYRIRDIDDTDVEEIKSGIEEWVTGDLKKFEDRYAPNDKPLKPCPFCGGEAEIRVESRPDCNICYDVKLVQCKNCYARTDERTCDGYYNEWCSDKTIAELWNQRV